MLPEGWRECRLGDLFENRKERGREGLPTFSVTMTEGLVDRKDLDRKQDSALSPSEHLLVERGDIVYNTMRMWQGAFGLADRTGIVSPAYVVLKPRPDVEPAFLAKLFRTPRMLHQFWAYSHGLTEDRLRLYFEDFAAIKAHVPPRLEQSCMADLIESWDRAISAARELCLRRRSEAGQVRERMIRAVLHYQRVPLSELAEVRTGLAKGKSSQLETIDLPYLRVANVQDGWLDLSDVKDIAVARDAVTRYSLQRGDVLMTEGGDLDKLGRGTVWAGDINPCLHQNHVFAVRPSAGRLHSGFMAAMAASEYGRSYFLGCAKRSTNLASINSTQLKAFPVPLAPPDEQERIASVVEVALRSVQIAEKVVEKLVEEKAALMVDLLTGKRRVRVPEAEATP